MHTSLRGHSLQMGTTQACISKEIMCFCRTTVIAYRCKQWKVSTEDRKKTFYTWKNILFKCAKQGLVFLGALIIQVTHAPTAPIDFKSSSTVKPKTKFYEVFSDDNISGWIPLEALWWMLLLSFFLQLFSSLLEYTINRKNIYCI